MFRMASLLYIDTETRSRIPIRRGTDLYCRSAECMIVTWAIDDGAVGCWDRMWSAQGSEMPLELADALSDPAVLKVAQNAVFDRNILDHALGWEIPASEWRCTRVQAYAHGLPGSLEMEGAVLGLAPADQKQAEEGHRLIKVFCEPQENGRFIEAADRLEEWKKFCAYAIQDTRTLRLVHKALPRHNYA